MIVSLVYKTQLSSDFFHKVTAVLLSVSCIDAFCSCSVTFSWVYYLNWLASEMRANMSVRFETACVAPDYHFDLSALSELVPLQTIEILKQQNLISFIFSHLVAMFHTWFKKNTHRGQIGGTSPNKILHLTFIYLSFWVFMKWFAELG